jgi:PIN domain nuclease of toxin-antitoxin system
VDLLLDTNALLWWLQSSERMNKAGYDAIANPANAVYVSVASAWEIAIKAGVGKLSVPPNIDSWLPARLVTERFAVLDVKLGHVLAVEHLPLHHRDPFDRLLIAQARVERLTLVTGDPQLEPYDVPLLRCESKT